MFNDYDIMMGLIAPGAMTICIVVTIGICIIASVIKRGK